MDILKRIAINTATDKDIVEKVINHSFLQLVKKSRECSSLEITGWGTFRLRKKGIPYYVEGIERNIEKLKLHLKELKSPAAIVSLEGKIEWMEKEITEIKKRYGME